MVSVNQNKNYANNMQESGQQAIEYLLMVVAVVVVVLAATASRGTFTRAVDDAVGKTMDSMDGTLRGRLCIPDADGNITEEAWSVPATWNPVSCGPGVEYLTRDVTCAGGCCEFPIPSSIQICEANP